MTIVRAVVVVVVVQSLVMQNVLLDVLQTMITSHFSSPVKKSVGYIKKESVQMFCARTLCPK